MNRLLLSSMNKICLNSNINGVTVMAKRFCGPVSDWKPGKYPVTQEERERAAKKYYLIPDDYKPYPEGSGYGDYPDMPIVGQDGRDPYEDFDWHYRRRNFGETLCVDYDIYTSDKHNPNERTQHSKLYMISWFCFLMLSFQIVVYSGTYFDMTFRYRMKPKQMPAPGVVHYTFEPLDLNYIN